MIEELWSVLYKQSSLLTEVLLYIEVLLNDALTLTDLSRSTISSSFSSSRFFFRVKMQIWNHSLGLKGLNESQSDKTADTFALFTCIFTYKIQVLYKLINENRDFEPLSISFKLLIIFEQNNYAGPWLPNTFLKP